MRSIKFRGIPILGKDFVFGDLIQKVIVLGYQEENPTEFRKGTKYFIRTQSNEFEVQKETIGQYTLLKDKKGKEIYEGDIMNDGIGMTFSITVEGFHGYRFMFGKDQVVKALGIHGEIIGNIYENPELLGK